MEANEMQTALDSLIRIKESLLEALVDELVRHKDDDSTSFSLQEIEDRFAIRLANLNTLIATLQDHMGHYGQGGGNRIVTNVQEVQRNKLQSKLEEMLEFVQPDDLLHLSVLNDGGKCIIVLAHAE